MEAFIEILKAIVLGIIQGITEWLPISSTGHMLLADQLMQLNQDQTFKDMFFVVIQLGSILAVVLLFFNKLNPFSPSKTTQEKHSTIDLWLKVIVGVIPLGIIGTLIDDWVTEKLYFPLVIAATLIIYGVLFLLLENRNRRVKPTIRSLDQLDYKTAALIGMLQLLAVVPGTSRSGSTILGAMLLGCSRYVAAEFSFFLAIPVMFGASALKLLKLGLPTSAMQWSILLVGSLVAFLVSLFAIKFLMQYIRKHDFKVFGWYRIALGSVVILFFVSQGMLAK